MINTIKNALNNEFLIQNFFGFALNEFLSNIQTKTKNTRNEFVLFYEEVLKDFCNKRNWEYDETTIEDNLQLLNISTVSNKTEVAQCLSTLFGTNFLEGEEEQLTNDWCESFNKVLNTHKYNYIEIINIIHSSMENMFQKLVSQTQKVISDNTENEICSNISTALMQMKYSNYSVAQKLLENILPKVANSPYEFSCLFNLGFCLHKLNDFRTSLNYYLQAESILSPNDDALLLTFNIALCYICLAEKEDKLKNTNKSNEYLKKALTFLEDNDTYYKNSILIHLSRNYMDIVLDDSAQHIKTNIEQSEKYWQELWDNDAQLTEEQYFIIQHNMGRLQYLKYLKLDDNVQLIYDSIKLFKECLKLTYVNNSIDLQIMVKNNLYISEMITLDDNLQKYNELIEKYENLINIAESDESVDHASDIIKFRLNILNLYEKMYSHNQCDFELYDKVITKAEDIFSKIPNCVNRNSWLKSSICLLQMYRLAILNDNPNINWDNIYRLINKIEDSFTFVKNKQTDLYDTFIIYKSHIELYKVYNDEDNIQKIQSLQKIVEKIMRSTKDSYNLYESSAVNNHIKANLEILLHEEQ